LDSVFPDTRLDYRDDSQVEMCGRNIDENIYVKAAALQGCVISRNKRATIRGVGKEIHKPTQVQTRADHYLDHEALDYAVEDDVVVVTVLSVGLKGEQ